MLGVVGDAFRGEELGHGARDVGTCDAHRRRFGSIDFDLDAVAKTLLAEPVIDQHRAFVRRCRTLVGWRGSEHDNATGTQIRQSGPERLGTAERVEVVARLGEVRDQFRPQLSAQRDHQVIRGDCLARNGHDPPVWIDVLDVADANVDALPRQSRQWTSDRVSGALADHEPQQ